ncbi:MAG: SPOR domain-containing protein [Candidatus Sulfotelmatobacter sp.]
MTSSEDTEITLGTGKLLGLFFFLVGICALCFAFGYSLGRKSEPAMAAASAVPATQPAPVAGKASSSTTAAGPPMTFYKSVEQKDTNPQLTPTTEAKPETPAQPANANTTPAQTPPVNPGDSTATLPTGGYLVQVAAVTKQEDADALVDALKKKDYPAFVAAQSASDKFFRVQVGPYSDIKDAEAMRTRLIGDGYSPIVKK